MRLYPSSALAQRDCLLALLEDAAGAAVTAALVCAEDVAGELMNPRSPHYSSGGSASLTRTMKSWNSFMYSRRKASVESTVTSPPSVIIPGVNWM